MSGPLVDLEQYQPALEETFERHDAVLAYLYGSQARGDAGPLSDVDVAVLFGPNAPESERFNRLLHLIGELACSAAMTCMWWIWPKVHHCCAIVSTVTASCSTAPTMRSECASRRRRCGTMWRLNRCAKSNASTLYNALAPLGSNPLQ